MPGAHARRRSDDHYVHGLRVVTVSLAGLGILAAVALPATDRLSKPATTIAQEAAVARPPRAAAAPMDLARSDEWWLGVMHAQKAWKAAQGQGITVAVLDTGVDGRHEDLAGQVGQGPDYTAGGRVLGSRYWGRHGTSIAGIIAGHGHGPGGSAGVIGMAPLAKILSIRVTWENNDPIRQSRGAALQDREAVAKGIRYAVDHGANVINMSLGGSNAAFNGTAADEVAIKYALDRGVVLVASMGNDGAPPTKKYFPAAYPGVIAVGAVDRRLKPWKDSNQGDYVSVAAPGVGIVSTDAGGSYQVTDGTSASSAIVAGVVALVRSRFPQMTPGQIKQVLEQGVTHQPVAGHDDRLGAGVVDAAKVLDTAAALEQTVTGPTPTPTPTKVAVSPKVAVTSAKSFNLVLVAILGGGGALVTTGLVLGWLQRRRPETDPDPVVVVGTAHDGEDEGWREAARRVPVTVGAGAPERLSPVPEPLTEPLTELQTQTEPIQQTTPAYALGELRPFDPEKDGEPSPPGNGNGNGNGNGHDNGNGHGKANGKSNGTAHGLSETAGEAASERDFWADPLGDLGPLPEIETAEVATPLADESWRRIRDRADEETVLGEAAAAAQGTAMGDEVAEDEFVADAFPAVGPVTDLPIQERREAPIRRPTPRAEHDDDYRPPWL